MTDIELGNYQIKECHICKTTEDETDIGICDIWDNEDYPPAWHCQQCCDVMHEIKWRKLE